MPEISVVIPFKDYVTEFRDAVRSVMSQTWTDFELILVDNRASIEARAVAGDAKRQDGRVRIVEEEIPGAASARNAGIRHSVGVYVALLDSDDLMKPDRLEIQRRVLSENPSTTLVGCDKEEISHDGRVVNPCDRPTIPYWARILFDKRASRRSGPFREPHTSTYFFRRSDAIQVGMFDPKYNPFWLEDTDFALKLFLLGDIHIVPKVLVAFRKHSEEVARRRERDLSSIRSLDRFYQTILWLVESGQITASPLDILRILSRWMRESGLKYLRFRGGIEVGRFLVRRALLTYPWGLHNIKAFLRTCVPAELLTKSLGYGEFYDDDIVSFTEPGYVRNLFPPRSGYPGNAHAAR